MLAETPTSVHASVLLQKTCGGYTAGRRVRKVFWGCFFFAGTCRDFPKLQPQFGAIGNIIKHDSLLNPKSPWTFLKAWLTHFDSAQQREALIGDL